MKMSKILFTQLVLLATKELPREACGFLGSLDDQILSIFPLPNEAKSHRNFFVKEIFVEKALKKLGEAGHELFAIYHSHPTSNPIPSQTDVQFHPDPQVKMGILSLKKEPQFKLFHIVNGTFIEYHFTIMD